MSTFSHRIQFNSLRPFSAIARHLAACGLACVVIAAVYSGAEARSLDDKERTALASTVSEFDAAMRENNFDRIIATVPPKVMNAIAGKAGIDAEKMRSMMSEMMKAMMKDVKIEQFSMDVSKADLKELASGAPYALIPTETVISAGEMGRVKQKSHTLALLDDGKWYLVRVSELQQLVIVREVYPEFTNVEFPQGSMEVLKQ